MLQKIFNLFKPKSSLYWENRYMQGGNSGAGSYGELADFKKRVIDRFCKEKNIQSVMEFGCGDGNQISLLNYSGKYTGLDISPKAVEYCREKFKNDPLKAFYQFPGKRGFCKQNGLHAELSLSLDVIYHLVEDEVFEPYMHELFSAADKFVIVYSSNDENIKDAAWHVRHRKFSSYVGQHFPQFKLIQYQKNEFPMELKDSNGGVGSFADFYFYERS